MRVKYSYGLIYNFSSLGLIQVTNFLLSLIVIPHLLRKVGADGYGVIAVAQVVMIFLSVFTEYGFNQTATREISLYRSDRDRVSRIFFAVLASKLLICLLCFLLLLAMLYMIPLFYENMNLYLLAFVFVIGQSLSISWFFQGIEKMHFIAITGLLSRLIFAALVFAFIQQKQDAALFLFFMGLGNVIGGLISVWIALQFFGIKFKRPGRSDIIHEFKDGWPVLATNLSMSACQYTGIFILRIFTNDLVVGYYGVAEKIYFAIKLMIGTFSQAIYPRVCQLVQAGRKQTLLFFRQHYIPFFVMTVIASGILFVFSGPVLHFFISYKHEGTSFLLRMMCIAIVIVCMNIPPFLVLLADKRKKSYLKIFLMGTVVNVVSNVVLVRFFEAKGTVFSILITELFITTGLWWEIYRLYSHGEIEKRNFVKSLFYESK